MKKSALIFLLSAAGVLRAETLSVQITSQSGEPTAAFLVSADKDGIFISTAANGGNSYKLPMANIREITVQEPTGWSAAMQAYGAGQYDAAEGMFARIADEHVKIVPMQDGYGSLARLYQFLCMKALGKLEVLGAAMDKQLANPLSLGPLYLEEFVDLEGWSLLGKKDWQSLGVFLKKFEDGNPLNLPQAPFKRVRTARLAELCYLRANLNEHGEKKPDMALLDYHRALTLDLGSNPALLRMAAVAALRLTDEKVQSTPGDEKLVKQAKSLALVCRDLGGKGALPADYEKYLK
ncbi:MAG: hypothetical protein R3F13_16970 [Prosthecobacter sp.]